MWNHKLNTLNKFIEDANIAQVKKMLSKGIDLNAGMAKNKKMPNYIPPLVMAVASGSKRPKAQKKYLEIIKSLITKGAKLDAVDDVDLSPIMLVSGVPNEFFDAFKLLVDKGAKVDIIGKENRSIVFYLASKGYIRSLEYLLEHRAEARKLINFANDCGNTPLIVSSEYGFWQVVKIFLSNGANIGHKNNQGATALLKAIWNKQVVCVKLLIDSGANLFLKITQDDIEYSLLCCATGFLEEAKEDHEKRLAEQNRNFLLEAGAGIVGMVKSGFLIRADELRQQDNGSQKKRCFDITNIENLRDVLSNKSENVQYRLNVDRLYLSCTHLIANHSYTSEERQLAKLIQDELVLYVKNKNLLSNAVVEESVVVQPPENIPIIKESESVKTIDLAVKLAQINLVFDEFLTPLIKYEYQKYENKHLQNELLKLLKNYLDQFYDLFDFAIAQFLKKYDKKGLGKIVMAGNSRIYKVNDQCVSVFRKNNQNVFVKDLMKCQNSFYKRLSGELVRRIPTGAAHVKANLVLGKVRSLELLIDVLFEQYSLYPLEYLLAGLESIQSVLNLSGGDFDSTRKELAVTAARFHFLMAKHYFLDYDYNLVSSEICYALKFLKSHNNQCENATLRNEIITFLLNAIETAIQQGSEDLVGIDQLLRLYENMAISSDGNVQIVRLRDAYETFLERVFSAINNENYSISYNSKEHMLYVSILRQDLNEQLTLSNMKTIDAGFYLNCDSKKITFQLMHANIIKRKCDNLFKKLLEIKKANDAELAREPLKTALPIVREDGFISAPLGFHVVEHQESAEHIQRSSKPPKKRRQEQETKKQDMQSLKETTVGATQSGLNFPERFRQQGFFPLSSNFIPDGTYYGVWSGIKGTEPVLKSITEETKKHYKDIAERGKILGYSSMGQQGLKFCLFQPKGTEQSVIQTLKIKDPNSGIRVYAELAHVTKEHQRLYDFGIAFKKK